MFRIKLSLHAIFLLFFCISLKAQGTPEAYLLDDFANELCSDPLRARIDNFLTEIQRNVGSTGYVVAAPDEAIPGKSEQYMNVMRNHVRFRGFEAARVTFQPIAAGDSTRFQFWIVPDGARPPEISSPGPVAPVLGTTLYNSSRIEKVVRGRVEFGEGIWSGGEPCDFGLDLSQFAEAIKSNMESTAYLLAAAKNRNEIMKAKTALRLTADDLNRRQKIARNRIQTIYAGIRKESEMQLWIVPKGGRPPAFRNGTLQQ